MMMVSRSPIIFLSLFEQCLDPLQYTRSITGAVSTSHTAAGRVPIPDRFFSAEFLNTHRCDGEF